MKIKIYKSRIVPLKFNTSLDKINNLRIRIIAITKATFMLEKFIQLNKIFWEFIQSFKNPVLKRATINPVNTTIKNPAVIICS